MTKIFFLFCVKHPFKSSRKSLITIAACLNLTELVSSHDWGQREIQRAIIPAPQHALPLPCLPCGGRETQEWQSRLIKSAFDELHAERTYKTRPVLFDSLIEQQIPLCHFSRSCGNWRLRLKQWVIWYLEMSRWLSVNIHCDHARLALSGSHKNQSQFQKSIIHQTQRDHTYH